MNFKIGKGSVFPGLRQSMKDQLVPVILTIAILAVALGSASLAVASPSCCAVGGSGGWSGADLLDNMGSEDSDNQQAKIAGPSPSSKPVESKQVIFTDVDAPSTNESEGSRGILIQPSQVSNKDVILNVDAKPQRYIKGAVHIDYLEFTDGSDRPRSTSELSCILGNAGISRSDPLVIYSDDLSAATYVYLILDSLGQESIRLLDGGLEGWTAAGKPSESVPAVLPQTSYLPALRSDLIVKDESAPKDLFASLRKDEPVAVYSNSGINASLRWYALELGGYDSKLYAGDSWAENLLKNNGEGGKIQAAATAAPARLPAIDVPSGPSGSKPSCH